MVDERRPAKKVVKKVVKKTVVVRPPESGGTTVRQAAPSAPRTVRAPGVSRAPRATAAAPPRDPAESRLAKLKARATTRPSIRIPTPPRRPGAGLGERARLVGSRIGERGRDAAFAAKERVVDGADWVRDLRLPLLSPLRAAAVTGFLVGLVAVALGWLSYELFSATRGTSAGGGWGALVLVVVSFLSFAVGELLLGGFGVEHGRFISSMSVMLVLVLVLTFFLNLAAGRGAWILFPLLGVITFMASCRVMQFAADQPNPR